GPDRPAGRLGGAPLLTAHPVRGRFRPGGGRVLFRRGGAGAGSWRGVPVVAGLGGRAALPAAGPGRGGAGGLAAAAVVAAHGLRLAFDGADRRAARRGRPAARRSRSEEHTSELQSPYDLVCRLLLEKKEFLKK